MPTPIPIATKSVEARSSAVTLEKLENLFAVRTPDGSESPIALYPTPGLKLWNTYGTGPIRGLLLMRSTLWVVSGNELYAVESDGTYKLIGAVEGNGNVRMIENGTHIGIAAGGKSYAANKSEILELPENNLNGAAYQDGYGIFTQAGTQFFWLTGVDDMTTINALDFSSADTFSDTVVGCISNHRNLAIFKERSSEWFYNAGVAAFPFVRSHILERGCKAPGSIAKAKTTVMWLGDDLAVYATTGQAPQRISPSEIEYAIEKQSSPQTAEAFVYQQEGRTFYQLSFSDLTIVYDIEARRWHNRWSKGLNRWRANCHSSAWGKELVGDYSNGKVYELDLDTLDDDGDTIIKRATFPPLHSGSNRAAMNQLRIKAEMGVGLTSGQGSDPKMMLDWTDNRGHTWSNEITASMGKKGEYQNQIEFNRLGAFRERTLRITVSDPVKTVILAAYAELEGRL